MFKEFSVGLNRENTDISKCQLGIVTRASFNANNFVYGFRFWRFHAVNKTFSSTAIKMIFPLYQLPTGTSIAVCVCNRNNFLAVFLAWGLPYVVFRGEGVDTAARGLHNWSINAFQAETAEDYIMRKILILAKNSTPRFLLRPCVFHTPCFPQPGTVYPRTPWTTGLRPRVFHLAFWNLCACF